MKIKSMILCMLFFILFVGLSGCGKAKTETDAGNALQTVTPSVTKSTPTPFINAEHDVTASPTINPDVLLHADESKSFLTGLWIPKDNVNDRPYAIMINNINHAYPQSGLEDADILYEALVEYGITRLMAIYETNDAKLENTERIGSVRSARHYYVSFANLYDAIFIHFGETSYAANKIEKLDIDHFDGLDGGTANAAYSRDNDIKAPHNVFLSFSTLIAAVEGTSTRTEYEKGQKSFFLFHEKDTDLISTESAQKVSVNFSSEEKPYFTYAPKTKLYSRYAFDTLHTDANTGNALIFKNLIVVFVKEWDIDDNGYQTMDLTDTTGTGYYITNGKLINITWTVDKSTSLMQYYDESNNELVINPGKTYFAIFPKTRISDVIVE